MNYERYIDKSLSPYEFVDFPIVRQLHNKNQYTITIGNRVYFQSYDSLIAFVTIDANHSIYINKSYINYSKTTSKHLYLFLKQYSELRIDNLRDLNSFIKRKFIKLFDY